MRSVQLVLLLGARRTPEGPHFAVRPRLLGEPLDGVEAVVARAHEIRERPFGVIPPALVLDHHRVAVLQQARDVIGEAADHALRQIRMVNQHRGHVLARLAPGKQHERVEPDAVAHWDHRHVLAVRVRGDVLEGFGVALLDGLRRERAHAGARQGQDARDSERDGECCTCSHHGDETHNAHVLPQEGIGTAHPPLTAAARRSAGFRPAPRAVRKKLVSHFSVPSLD